MQRVNLYQFYRFGYAVQVLSTINNKSLLLDEYTTLFDAQRALKDLLAQSQISMVGIKPTIEVLIHRINEIMNIAESGQEITEETTIPAKKVFALKQAFSRFETVFEAEMVDRGINAYAVTPKGIYDTSLLITNADLIIPEDLRSLLSATAQQDLRESGRCLAFELPTSAGFHVLRAAESVIKQYYQSLTGKDWDETHRESQRNWGNYIDGLKASGAKENITDSLGQIKNLYRNPLVHPEATLTGNEAISLFNLCTSVIALMLQEIQELEDGD